MWRASHFLHFIFLPIPSFPPFILKEPQSGVTYHTSMAGKGLMYQGVDTKGSSRVAGRFAGRFATPFGKKLFREHDLLI